MGPWSYAKHLISGSRLPFTAAYFGSIALTLYFAIGVSAFSLRSIILELHTPSPLLLFSGCTSGFGCTALSGTKGNLAFPTPYLAVRRDSLCVPTCPGFKCAGLIDITLYSIDVSCNGGLGDRTHPKVETNSKSLVSPTLRLPDHSELSQPPRFTVPGISLPHDPLNLCVESPCKKNWTNAHSLQLQSLFLTLISSIFQIAALIWYLVSYFPMGSTGLQYVGRFGASRVTNWMAG